MKPILIKFGVGVLVLAASFGAGRYLTPTKVITKDHLVETKQVDTTKYVKQIQDLETQVASLQVELSNVKAHTHVVTHTIRHRNGTVETTTTRDTEVTKNTTNVKAGVEKHTDHTTTNTNTHTVEVTHKDLTKEKIVEREHPQWLLSPMVGFNVRNLSLKDGLGTGPLVFGGAVQHRILGPILVGAWALSSGEGGLVLTVEF